MIKVLSLLIFFENYVPLILNMKNKSDVFTFQAGS